jgi:hypothetical protein
VQSRHSRDGGESRRLTTRRLARIVIGDVAGAGNG